MPYRVSLVASFVGKSARGRFPSLSQPNIHQDGSGFNGIELALLDSRRYILQHGVWRFLVAHKTEPWQRWGDDDLWKIDGYQSMRSLFISGSSETLSTSGLNERICPARRLGGYGSSRKLRLTNGSMQGRPQGPAKARRTEE